MIFRVKILRRGSFKTCSRGRTSTDQSSFHTSRYFLIQHVLRCTFHDGEIWRTFPFFISPAARGCQKPVFHISHQHHDFPSPEEHSVDAPFNCLLHHTSIISVGCSPREIGLRASAWSQVVLSSQRCQKPTSGFRSGNALRTPEKLTNMFILFV